MIFCIFQEINFGRVNFFRKLKLIETVFLFIEKKALKRGVALWRNEGALERKLNYPIVFASSKYKTQSKYDGDHNSQTMASSASPPTNQPRQKTTTTVY